MKFCYILRGCSGAGKSFLAKQIVRNCPAPSRAFICSADHYMVDAEGIYNFDATKLRYCHERCRAEFKQYIDADMNCVIVDNTNIRKREYACYIDYAVAHGYFVQIVEPNTPWARNTTECAQRNTHEVPLGTIERMLARWEPAEQANYQDWDLIEREYTLE